MSVDFTTGERAFFVALFTVASIILGVAARAVWLHVHGPCEPAVAALPDQATSLRMVCPHIAHRPRVEGAAVHCDCPKETP